MPILIRIRLIARTLTILLAVAVIDRLGPTRALADGISQASPSSIQQTFSPKGHHYSISMPASWSADATVTQLLGVQVDVLHGPTSVSGPVPGVSIMCMPVDPGMSSEDMAAASAKGIQQTFKTQPTKQAGVATGAGPGVLLMFDIVTPNGTQVRQAQFHLVDHYCAWVLILTSGRADFASDMSLFQEMLATFVTHVFVTPPIFGPSGIAPVVFTGGPVEALEDMTRDAGGSGVWARDRSGEFQLLVVGGPLFVNDRFRDAFRSGVPGNTALTLVAGSAAQQPEPMSPPEEILLLGKRLATSNGCTACHSVNGFAGVGPTWKGLFGAQVRLADGSSVVANEDYLRESIINPGSKIVKGFANMMPSNYREKLSGEQLEAIIAYIQSLK